MRSIGVAVVVSLGVWLLAAGMGPAKLVAAANEKIAVTDDCDPNADWGVNGCLREEGSVTRAEFGAFLIPSQLALLSSAVLGHPSWRIAPGYLTIEAGETLRVRNTGGRTHTFTEVARFGGGKIPSQALNFGLITAPECPASVNLAPGERAEVTGLGLGNHSFQCCIHPWMRGVVKVVPQQ